MMICPVSQGSRFFSSIQKKKHSGAPRFGAKIVTGPAFREFSNKEMKVLFISINKNKSSYVIQKLEKSKVNLTATACYLIGAYRLAYW
jgi:hypothetical protein